MCTGIPFPGALVVNGTRISHECAIAIVLMSLTHKVYQGMPLCERNDLNDNHNYHQIPLYPLSLGKEKSGLGPGGLLLATLPLILAPALSYIFTPMVMPVTSAIAGGRKRKRKRRSLNLHLKNCFREKNPLKITSTQYT